MGINSQKVLVHRLTWEWANGPIPEGMTVDHKDCNRPGCVEPMHLQLLSLSDNKIKSDASSDWEPGTCKRGHDDSFRRPVMNRRKDGTPYETTVCGECVRERHRGRVSPTI